MTNNISTALTDLDRARIVAEEVCREEVRASLRDQESSMWRLRVWKALNSSFAIFVLSSIVLGTVSWQYQRQVSSRAKQTELALLREEASLELRYRFFIMAEVLKESNAKGRDGFYVRAVFFGQAPYAPAVSRFDSVSIPALLFLLKREKLADPLEEIIAAAMPKMSVVVQGLSGFQEDQLLDKSVREEMLGIVAKTKLLSLRW